MISDEEVEEVFAEDYDEEDNVHASDEEMETENKEMEEAEDNEVRLHLGSHKIYHAENGKKFAKYDTISPSGNFHWDMAQVGLLSYKFVAASLLSLKCDLPHTICILCLHRRESNET